MIETLEYMLHCAIWSEQTMLNVATIGDEARRAWSDASDHSFRLMRERYVPAAALDANQVRERWLSP